MRLIDADELRDRVGYIEYEYGHINEEIDKMPTIDAEPVKHGHWVDGKDMMYCSECSETYDKGYRLDYNYCPNCGAKMDLDEVNDDN